MEIIKQATDNPQELAVLSCCWPPGGRKMDSPAPEE